MPGTVKVRVLSARDLPIMDRTSELTDAFVEVATSGTWQAHTHVRPYDCTVVETGREISAYSCLS